VINTVHLGDDNDHPVTDVAVNAGGDDGDDDVSVSAARQSESRTCTVY